MLIVPAISGFCMQNYCIIVVWWKQISWKLPSRSRDAVYRCLVYSLHHCNPYTSNLGSLLRAIWSCVYLSLVLNSLDYELATKYITGPWGVEWRHSANESSISHSQMNYDILLLSGHRTHSDWYWAGPWIFPPWQSSTHRAVKRATCLPEVFTVRPFNIVLDRPTSLGPNDSRATLKYRIRDRYVIESGNCSVGLQRYWAQTPLYTTLYSCRVKRRSIWRASLLRECFLMILRARPWLCLASEPFCIVKNAIASSSCSFKAYCCTCSCQVCQCDNRVAWGSHEIAGRSAWTTAYNITITSSHLTAGDQLYVCLPDWLVGHCNE